MNFASKWAEKHPAMFWAILTFIATVPTILQWIYPSGLSAINQTVLSIVAIFWPATIITVQHFVYRTSYKNIQAQNENLIRDTGKYFANQENASKVSDSASAQMILIERELRDMKKERDEQNDKIKTAARLIYAQQEQLKRYGADAGDIPEGFNL